MMSREEINYGAENKLEIFIGAKIDASVVRLHQLEISIAPSTGVNRLPLAT
jgi:hypothetical protein